MHIQDNFSDPRSVSVTRATVLYALGAAIGLAIAGYGLFTATGTSTRSVAPENIATVNQRVILRSDFLAQLENETGAPAAQATRAEQLKVLDEMIREELLVQRGMELDFAETDQEVRNALVSAMLQLAAARVTTSQPSTEQVRRYFDAHRADYATVGTLIVRDLVLPRDGRLTDEQTVARAREAADALRSGPVDAVVARFGLKEPVRNESDWYWVAKLHLGDALFARVEGLKAGEVSEPVVARDGVHIAKVVENQPPVPLSFEASEARVRTDYDNAEAEKLRRETLTFLRQRATILIASDYSDYKP